MTPTLQSSLGCIFLHSSHSKEQHTGLKAKTWFYLSLDIQYKVRWTSTSCIREWRVSLLTRDIKSSEGTNGLSIFNDLKKTGYGNAADFFVIFMCEFIHELHTITWHVPSVHYQSICSTDWKRFINLPTDHEVIPSVIKHMYFYTDFLFKMLVKCTGYFTCFLHFKITIKNPNMQLPHIWRLIDLGCT